jgi:hypothetical protein
VHPATSPPRSSPDPANGDEPEEEGKGEEEPYWAKAGFGSSHEYFDQIEAERAKVQRYLEPPRRRIPTPDFPANQAIVDRDRGSGESD